MIKFPSQLDPVDETAGQKPLDEILEDISNLLEEAWSLPEHQRKQVIKRLLLKWHPDKNKGQVIIHNYFFNRLSIQHVQINI